MHFCRRRVSFCTPMSYQLAAMSRKRWTATFTLSLQMFFQLRKQMIVTGCQVRTIGWVGDDAPSKPIQESNGLTGDMGVSIIVEKAYALGQHSSSLVLNHPSEFFECLTIPFSVYCGPMSHEVDQYPLSIPKHSCHNFAGRLCSYEFSRLGRRGMLTLT